MKSIKIRGTHKKGFTPFTPGVYYNGFWFAENKDGYYRSRNGGGMLHRVIWECLIGEIPKGFSIHHINGNRKDNRIENLEMVHKSTHATYHNTGRVYSAETCEKLSSSITKAWAGYSDEKRERIKRKPKT